MGVNWAGKASGAQGPAAWEVHQYAGALSPATSASKAGSKHHSQHTGIDSQEPGNPAGKQTSQSPEPGSSDLLFSG